MGSRLYGSMNERVKCASNDAHDAKRMRVSIKETHEKSLKKETELNRKDNMNEMNRKFLRLQLKMKKKKQYYLFFSFLKLYSHFFLHAGIFRSMQFIV